MLYERTISAICCSLIQEYTGSEKGSDARPIVRFVLAQQKRMADLFRLPLVLVTIGFSCFSLLSHGRFFHRISLEERKRQISMWRGSRISLYRDLIRFYESFIILAIYTPKSIVSHMEKDFEAS